MFFPVELLRYIFEFLPSPIKGDLYFYLIGREILEERKDEIIRKGYRELADMIEAKDQRLLDVALSNSLLPFNNDLVYVAIWVCRWKRLDLLRLIDLSNLDDHDKRSLRQASAYSIDPDVMKYVSSQIGYDRIEILHGVAQGGHLHILKALLQEMRITKSLIIDLMVSAGVDCQIGILSYLFSLERISGPEAHCVMKFSCIGGHKEVLEFFKSKGYCIWGKERYDDLLEIWGYHETAAWIREIRTKH